MRIKQARLTILRLIASSVMLCILGLQINAQGERLTSYGLLFQYETQNQHQFWMLTPDGERSLIYEDALSIVDAHVSPDHEFIVYRDSGDDLYTVNVEGELEGRISLSDISAEGTWQLWGWRDENTIVVSQNHDSNLVTLTLSSDFSQIAVLHTLETRGFVPEMTVYEPSNFVSFNPNFDRLLSPLQLGDESASEDVTPTLPIYLWEIDSENAVPIYSFRNMVEWWYEHRAQPDWTSDGEQVVFPTFEPESSEHQLIVYDVVAQTQHVIYENSCGDCVYLLSPRWDHSNQRIAFWNPQEMWHLMIVSLLPQEDITIFAGNTAPRDIFWSPDDRLLATTIFDDSGSALTIFDSETGEIISDFHTEADDSAQIVGWFRVNN